MHRIGAQKVRCERRIDPLKDSSRVPRRQGLGQGWAEALPGDLGRPSSGHTNARSRGGADDHPWPLIDFYRVWFLHDAERCQDARRIGAMQLDPAPDPTTDPPCTGWRKSCAARQRPWVLPRCHAQATQNAIACAVLCQRLPTNPWPGWRKVPVIEPRSWLASPPVCPSTSTERPPTHDERLASAAARLHLRGVGLQPPGICLMNAHGWHGVDYRAVGDRRIQSVRWDENQRRFLRDRTSN